MIMNEPCRFHPALQATIESLVGQIGEQSAHNTHQQEQLSKLCEKVDKIQSAVDKNEISAKNRDNRLDEIKEISHASLQKWDDMKSDVEKVQYTIENGINARVTRLTEVVGEIKTCIERRREEYNAKLAEEAEFSFWIKFLKSIARRINTMWEKNGILIILAILWSLFNNDAAGGKYLLKLLGISW